MKNSAQILFCSLMLSFVQAFAGGTNDNWTDRSPHKEALIIANGVHLQYLDWGGTGDAIIFLAGLGDSAHIFDNIAPEFTNQFHVLAVTRRGFGKSDQPKTGYEIDALTDDLRQFLEALTIKRAALVGHSFAGVELTRFAERFPDCVIKLVFLDASYDYAAAGPELLSALDAIAENPSAQDRTNYVALRQWFRTHRPGWNDACEANFRDTRSPASKLWSFCTTPPEIMGLLGKEAFEFKPDYTKTTMPALAFFADHNFDKLLAVANETGRKKDVETLTSAKKWQRDQMDRFKHDARHGEIVMLLDTDHFCFIQRQDEVVRSMQSFLKSD